MANWDYSHELGYQNPHTMESKMYTRDTRKESPEKNVQHMMLLFISYICSMLTPSQCTHEVTILGILCALLCRRHRKHINPHRCAPKRNTKKTLGPTQGCAFFTYIFLGGVPDRARSSYETRISCAVNYKGPVGNFKFKDHIKRNKHPSLSKNGPLSL